MGESWDITYYYIIQQVLAFWESPFLIWRGQPHKVVFAGWWSEIKVTYMKLRLIYNLTKLGERRAGD
jgi:hypothetical protein